MAEFLTDSVKTAYDQFYTNDRTAWRMLGAKYKSQNIVDVCKDIKPTKVLEVAGDGSILHFLSYGHINMYTPTSLRFLLQSEGLNILKNKLSLTDSEITRFSEFTIKKAPKTFSGNLKINLVYPIKKLMGSLLEKKKQEQFANTYTALTKKSNQDIHIF